MIHHDRLIDHDASWWIMIHHDLSRWIMIHHDGSWSVMMAHDHACWIMGMHFFVEVVVIKIIIIIIISAYCQHIKLSYCQISISYHITPYHIIPYNILPYSNIVAFIVFLVFAWYRLRLHDWFHGVGEARPLLTICWSSS